ncbi:MAG: nitrate/sulfonate/bicarbonate ABC transporter ATP-binding protein [Pelagibacteraceae bacterium]|nr:nitrate/sulfonate/bicarbonate ABC transporter ATP-binding protein [Pelagibacteraceae bacterium]
MVLRLLTEKERQKNIDNNQSRLIAQLSSVTKKFKSSKQNSLSNIDLEVYQGDFLSILGPSGCGKTSILKMMCGLLKPTSGKINWPTSNFQNSPENPANLSFVFQEPNLLPWINVYENIKLPLKILGENNYKADEKIYDIINLVGLKGFEDYYPGQLSGGMSMRVSIARALVTQPKVLLMDEPFSALDETRRFGLSQEILKIKKEKDLTVIYVTHSIYESVFLSNRIYVMQSYPGKIFEEFDFSNQEKMEDYRFTPQFFEQTKIVSDSLERSQNVK